MSGRGVYIAINAVSSELAAVGIPKNHLNEFADYRYRSIDDLLGRLAPLLAKYRLCVLPRVVERQALERREDPHLLLHVTLRVAFDFTSVDDGSSHSVEAYGEALDASDKATAKAMSAAYKTAMIQSFCIAVAGADDPDRETPKLIERTHHPEPVQGWEQWCRDIQDIVGVCESEGAIDLVQERHRELLKSLSRERFDLYNEIGSSVVARREELSARGCETRKDARSQKHQSSKRSTELEGA